MIKDEEFREHYKILTYNINESKQGPCNLFKKLYTVHIQ